MVWFYDWRESGGHPREPRQTFMSENNDSKLRTKGPTAHAICSEEAALRDPESRLYFSRAGRAGQADLLKIMFMYINAQYKKFNMSIGIFHGTPGVRFKLVFVPPILEMVITRISQRIHVETSLNCIYFLYNIASAGYIPP